MCYVKNLHYVCDMERVIGIDPGSEESGMVVLDGYDIIGAYNLKNDYNLFDKVTNFSIHKPLTVVIEDIKPYSLKLMPQVIDTCKFIGEAVFRLKTHCGLNVIMVDRYRVKRWVFDAFPEVCLPIIDGKIEKKIFDACNVETRELVRINDKGMTKRKASFHYVNDKVVMEAMKHLYKIPLPPPGKGYQYGLQSHSFQALAVATCFIHNRPALTSF